MTSTKTYPDKELWDKLGLGQHDYEYVKLPYKVAKILKRKVGDEVLLSYYRIYGDTRIKILHYARYECGTMYKGPGYCSDKSTWEEIAQEIAETYPKYQVKHRKP